MVPPSTVAEEPGAGGADRPAQSGLKKLVGWLSALLLYAVLSIGAAATSWLLLQGGMPASPALGHTH